MNEKSGEKSLLFNRFESVPKIRDEYLVGKSIWMVLPQKASVVAAKQFSALITVMRKENMAIIARYTHSRASTPKRVALFANSDSMHMYELFYKQDRTPLKFPLLKSKASNPSADELNIMDKFIDSMDLTNHKSDPNQPPKEAFAKLVDPGLQHMYRAIANRALNPNSSVLEIEKEIADLITPPQSIDPTLESEMKVLFELKAKKLSYKESIMYKLEDEVDSVASTLSDLCFDDSIVIGTIDPAWDFVKLVHRGEPFTMIAKKLENVILEILKTSRTKDEEIVAALNAYRGVAKDKAPNQYNKWIASIKQILMEHEHSGLWQEVVNLNLGLIPDTRNELSFVSLEESKDFYKSEDKKNSEDQLDSGFAENSFSSCEAPILSNSPDLFDEM